MEELLNAYHDGQLNSREIAKVEHLLENDADAKLLLAQIAQTSQLVRQLPRAEAPESLRAEIQYQLERDQLLNPQADHFQRVGRTHLRFRRFTAAAAVILLAGAVGTMIYSVVVNPPAVELTNQLETVADHDSPSPEIPMARPKNPLNAAKAQEMIAALLVTTPNYNQLHLNIHSSQGTMRLENLEAALAENNIDHFVRLPLDENKVQYAFYCRLDQLRPFVHHVASDSRLSVDIVAAGAADQLPVVITGASESQILTFASLGDPMEQLALAQRWQSDLENPLPDWLVNAFAQSEPEISDLKILGPTNIQNDSVSPPSPLVANLSQPKESSEKTNGVESVRTLPADIHIGEKKSPLPSAEPGNQNVAVILTCTLQRILPAETSDQELGYPEFPWAK